MATRYAWAARLRAVFGATLEEVEEEHLAELVAQRVRESEDLDFKRDPYGNSDPAKRELASDIAALANDRGGIIIIGVREAGETAVELTPTESTAEEQRIRSIGTDNIRPYAAFDVRLVESKLTPGSVFYMVIVPPSADRPHAVRKDNDLRYPRRNGGQTRWLAEAEVADAYRDRFSRVMEDAGKAERAVDEGLAAMESRETVPVIAVAVVPSIATHMAIDSAALARLEEWLTQSDFRSNSVFGGPWTQIVPRLGVGVRRILMGALGSNGLSTAFVYAELHADGGAFVGLPLYYADPLMQTSPQEPAISRVSAATLTRGLAVSLRFAGRLSAERAGGFGDARVVAALRGGPLVLMARDGDGFPHPLGTVQAETIYSRHSLPLDSMHAFSPDLMVAARLVANDLFQAFGIPETPVIGADGSVRRRAFSSAESQGLSEWAEQHGIELE